MEEPKPKDPGCYFTYMTQPTKQHQKYRLGQWHKDVWGEKNKNTLNDPKACMKREDDYQKWAGAQDVNMIHIPKSAAKSVTKTAAKPGSPTAIATAAQKAAAALKALEEAKKPGTPPAVLAAAAKKAAEAQKALEAAKKGIVTTGVQLAAKKALAAKSIQAAKAPLVKPKSAQLPQVKLPADQKATGVALKAALGQVSDPMQAAMANIVIQRISQEKDINKLKQGIQRISKNKSIKPDIKNQVIKAVNERLRQLQVASVNDPGKIQNMVQSALNMFSSLL